MKKVIATMLSALCVVPCFACAGKSQPEIEQPKNPQKPQEVNYSINVRIQDSEGIDKCFWDDGKIYFDAWCGENNRQKEQSANNLSVGCEYDLCFVYYLDKIMIEPYPYGLYSNFDIGIKKVKYETKFEYDETKLEIKVNPDIKGYYILKVLAPLENENIMCILNEIYTADDIECTRKFPVKLNTEELSGK